MSEPAKERFFRLLGLFQAGRFQEAQETLTKALCLAPKDPNLLHLAAQTAEALGDKTRAAGLYRRAGAAHPGWFEAQFNLARLLGLLDDAESKKESISLFKEMTRLFPTRPEPWAAQARLAQTDKRLEEALGLWREALARAPQDPDLQGQTILAARQLCAWDEIPPPSADLPPPILFLTADDPALQKESARRFTARRYGALRPLPAPPSYAHERLRVGYLSSDFHAHATAYLMAELFTLHDKNAFEVFVYSYGIDDGSPLRARLQQEAEHFIQLNACTALQSAEKIRADEIDILIDLKGHTHGGRLDILAYRPAPIQIHWLGFPATTGAPFIDYFVADPTTAPSGADKDFTEKLLRLPVSYQINDRTRIIATPEPRAAYGLSEEALVLASFNQSYKITQEVFEIWCEILHAIPEAVLWLLEDFPESSARLRTEAAARGIAPERLIFAPPLPLAEHLARYRVADLALDTFPVGGHTTTSDALWAGAPVITRAGESFVSRVAAGLLRACDLPSLVAFSGQEYRTRILDLARNKAAREAIRRHLETKHETLALFDTPRFVKAWEEVLTSCAKPTEKSSS